MTADGTVVHLVCGFDDGYAMPAGVMLRSAVQSLRPDVRCVAHLVGIDLSPDSRSRLASLADDRLEVRFPDFDPAWIAGLPTAPSVAKHLNATVFIGVLADRFLPPEVDRWVTIDADMIVTSSIDEVTTADFGECVIAAVRDYWIPAAGMQGGVKLWRELGIDSRSPYFNGGLVAGDRSRWRDADVEARTFAYLHDHRDDVRFLEQEAMNVVLAGRWHELPPRWNYLAFLPQLQRDGKDWIFGMVPGHELDEAATSPSIIHYAGPWKPWLPHAEPIAFEERWWDAVRDTPWADFPRPAPPGRWPTGKELYRRARRAAGVLVHGS